jgi:hypothetical protein
LDPSAIGRTAEVGHAGFENPFGCRDVPCIGHLESFPKAAPDAAAAIAPGEAAGESEFRRGLVVEAVLPDFFSDFFAAGEVRCGVVFPRKLIEEGVRCLNRIGGATGFVGQQWRVVRGKGTATEGTLRGDIHFIRSNGWKATA